jgi:hypothetical protein
MSTLRLTTLSNQGGTASVPSDTVINGTAKAWVNFNGQGTVAIRASFNVSSITDNGTGDYTTNFVTAFSDNKYSTVISASDIAYGVVPYIHTAGNMLTTSCRFQNRGNYLGDPPLYDIEVCCVAIFR